MVCRGLGAGPIGRIGPRRETSRNRRPANPPSRQVVTMIRAPGSANDLAALSDEELLSRYRESGRTADFDELVRRYERELYRYLVRYLGDAALAEDVFQNTFLQVHL